MRDDVKLFLCFTCAFGNYGVRSPNFARSLCLNIRFARIYTYKASKCKHAIIRLQCATSKSSIWYIENMYPMAVPLNAHMPTHLSYKYIPRDVYYITGSMYISLAVHILLDTKSPALYVIVVSWFLQCMGYVLRKGCMHFRGQSTSKYIQHEGGTIPCTVKKNMRQLSCTDRPYKATGFGARI